MDIYGDVYGAFEIAADEGVSSLTEEGIDETWAKAITEVAENNITPPEVHITGYVDIENYEPNGVEIIKKALQSAQRMKDVEVQCVGAPRYRITVKSTDYILAEKTLKKAADKCLKIIEDSNGKGEFLRELD